MRKKYKTTFTISGNKSVTYTVYKMILLTTGLYYYGVTSNFVVRKRTHRQFYWAGPLRFYVILKTCSCDTASAKEQELIIASATDDLCMNKQKTSRYNKKCFIVKK